MISATSKRRLFWTLGLIFILALVLVAGSHYVNPMIRTRIERAMNRNLVGYHTHLRSAHLRLLDGTLFLYGLNVVQEGHPKPAVMEIPVLRVSIQWREVFSRRIVADCLLSQPTASINLIQLRSERARKITLKQEGWQRALETVYPFKINKFRIDTGTVTYIDSDPTKPIKFQHLNFVADNIRNIHLPEHRYPSTFHLDSVVFDTGHANLNGHANFLAEPLPSVLTRYRIDRVPLDPLDPPIKRVNLRVKDGVLSSEGVLEYSTDRKRAEAKQIQIDGVHVTYVHTPQTASAESSRFKTIKQTAARASNAPGLLLEVHELQLNKSIVAFSNDDSDRRYVLYLSDFNAHLTNLSNHSGEGISNINAHARFMGTGASSLAGTFRPQKHGSDFDLNLAVGQASLPSLNDLLRAYGRFDVQSGNVSIYSQASVRRGAISGYIKMLFNDVVVYNREKDKNKPLLHQAYELAIGGAAKLLKNRSTQHVATEVKLNGKLNSPTTSTWEALGNLVSNAFVNAIEPGFERVIGRVSDSDSEVNQHRSVHNAESQPDGMPRR
jgi:hypothetical protein